MMCGRLITYISILYGYNLAEALEGTIRFHFEKYQSWNDAYRTCAEKGRRLPSVRAARGAYYLTDQILIGSSDCFWLGAISRGVSEFQNDTYLNSCCEAIWKTPGGGKNHDKSCEDCGKYLSFVCETGPNTLSDRPLYPSYLPWKNASEKCKMNKLDLPSENNQGLLAKPLLSQHWINVVRRFIISTRMADEDSLYLCYCSGNITDLKCSNILITYCLPAHPGESQMDITTSISSNDIHGLVATSTTIPPVALSAEMISQTIPSITINNADMTLPTVSSITVHTTNAMVLEMRLDIWPIVGSVVGVIAIGITTIVVIMVLRRRRVKDDDAAITNTTDNVPKSKFLLQKNLSYNNDLEEEGASLKENNTTSQQVFVLQEQQIYAQPQKVKKETGNQANLQSARPTKDSRTKPVEYSTVQKVEKINYKTNNINESEDLGKEYDRIYFANSDKPESCENVYNKANIHRTLLYEDHAGNGYEKADFCLEKFEVYTGNVYDKAQFDGHERPHKDTSYCMKVSIDPSYDHLKK